MDSVQGANTSLARSSLRDELAALRRRAGKGDIEIGGADLAAEAIRQKLVDEYWLLVNPVAVGGGVPFFPREQRVDMYYGERLLRYRSRFTGNGYALEFEREELAIGPSFVWLR